ncbi:unnamed protein product, partial [Choristocarpus tenellus]
MKIPRSTKVRAEKSQGKVKGKFKAKGKGKSKGNGAGKTKGGKEGMVTWDYDSDSDEAPSNGPKSEKDTDISNGEASRRDAGGAVAGGKRRRSSSQSEGEDEGQDVPVTLASEEEASGEESNAGDEDGGVGLSGGREDSPGVRGGEGNTNEGGGMGDVMARILGQKLENRTQAPVLAKRKTKVMREMEEDAVKRSDARGKAAAKRAKLTTQFHVPDHTTTDYERKLKKIAMRGVVALFNAISKRQRGEGLDDKGLGTGNTAKAAALKGASKNAFLSMLKSSIKPGDDSATSKGGVGVRTLGAAVDERSRGGGGIGGGRGGGGPFDK